MNLAKKIIKNLHNYYAELRTYIQYIYIKNLKADKLFAYTQYVAWHDHAWSIFTIQYLIYTADFSYICM